MIEGLAVFCISGCIGLEICCAVRLRRILRIRSEERTDNRRAYYRDKAYKVKAEARALKDARQKLWRSLQK